MNEKIEEAFSENEVPCLDRSDIRYQRRPYPRTAVEVQIGILGIYSISSSKMEMKADIYLYQSWTDYRCKFEPKNNKTSNLTIYARPNGLTHKGLQNLWQPDTHLLNAKATKLPETVTHIWQRGKVSQEYIAFYVAYCLEKILHLNVYII